MSIPEFPKPDANLTQEQALTMILSSIAMEEVALSHIMNAQGEKIQYILGSANCGCRSSDLKDIVAVNKSVTNLMEIVLQNQMILKNKMEKVLEYLPKPTCPPEPPCPPVCPCTPEACCECSQFACFCLIPKTYYCNEPLQWMEGYSSDHFALSPDCPSKILLPRTGFFMVDIDMEIDCLKCSHGDLKLIISCLDKKPIIKKIYFNKCQKSATSHIKSMVQMPCSCCPCYATVLVCEPCGVHARKGRIVFTKL